MIHNVDIEPAVAKEYRIRGWVVKIDGLHITASRACWYGYPTAGVGIQSGMCQDRCGT